MKKAKVFGLDIPIKYTDLSHTDNDGLYCSKTRCMSVHKSLKGKEKLSVELHELVHAFADRLGWRDVLGDQAEELLCNQLPALLMDNFEMKWRK